MSSCELFDPTLGTWSSTGSFATARQEHAMTLLSGGTKVLVAGGSGSPLTSRLYDIAGGTWTSIAAALNKARSHRPSAIVLDDGKVLLLGGTAAAAGTGITELFDPIGLTWTTTTGTIPVATNGLNFQEAQKLPDGTVIAIGGTNVASTYYTAAYIYTPSTQLWAATASMVEQRSEFSSLLLDDGTVMVMGGYSNIVGGYRQKKTTEIYDPNTGLWTAGIDMTRTRYEHTATLLDDGRPLVVGGQSGPEYDEDGTNTAEVFTTGEPPDPATALYILPSSFPTLIDRLTDPTDAVVTTVIKDIVPYGSELVTGFAELFAMNKYRSIQIVSSIDLHRLPPPDVYTTSRSISLPDQLISVGPVWDQTISSGTESNPHNFSGSVNASASVHGTIVVVKKGGFRGAALARVERVFFYGAPPDISVPSPTIIRPSTGTAYVIGRSVNTSEQGSTVVPPICVAGAHAGLPAQPGDIIGYDGVIGQAFGLLPMIMVGSITPQVTSGSSGGNGSTTQVVDISNVLTSGIVRSSQFTAEQNSNSGGILVSALATGDFSANIPPSCPTSLPAGAPILSDVIVEKYRLGLFTRTIVYVIAPGDCT